MPSDKLKVAHINTEKTWRGGEQQVFYLMQGLAKKGHENLAVVKTGSIFSKRCQKAGIPTLEVSPWGEWDIFAGGRLKSEILKRGIDVLHAHASHGAALAALASRGTSIPFVISRRVDFPLSRNPFSRWKYDKAAMILAISHGVKKVLLSDGIREEKIALVPSGIDFSRFDEVCPIQREEIGVPKDALLIGQVAALADHKDQGTFLRSLAILKKNVPHIHAVILGDGDQEKKLKALARELQVDSFVQFLGFRSDPLRYLKAFDIFCLSSKLEGLGTSILDAMACRIPVVATRAGGIPEIIEDGISGFLSHPRDPQSLAATLARAIKEGIGNPVLSQKAFEKAQTFDVSHTIDKSEAIYKTLLKY